MADDVCTECGRLREQARAALLSGDGSRLTDVRVLQRRHAAAAHAGAAPKSTEGAPPGLERAQ